MYYFGWSFEAEGAAASNSNNEFHESQLTNGSDVSEQTLITLHQAVEAGNLNTIEILIRNS